MNNICIYWFVTALDHGWVIMKAILKKATILVVAITYVISLSGCLAAAALVGGAAGGSYLQKNYQIEKKQDTQQEQEQESDNN